VAIHDFEEGDGYFASISDLMVGILFVFLLMLTVFALNYREAEHDQEIRRQQFEREAEKARLAEERARLAEEKSTTAGNPRRPPSQTTGRCSGSAPT
jgi:chemotaxis protein MotB